jgi:dethiobiotin synthetase
MKQAYFLTGTDTDIGKTFVTCALLWRANQLGRKAAGLKPVAAGTDASGLNDDVVQIRAASNVLLPLAVINPYCFKAAIAPHIATIQKTLECASEQADLLIIEGAGGFRVPLGNDGDSADLAVALGLPVILVVGMRLGCINHALLTVEAITTRGLKVAGWVANRIDPEMSCFAENLATLQGLIPAPLLGVVPYDLTGDAVAAGRHLNLPESIGCPD